MKNPKLIIKLSPFVAVIIFFAVILFQAKIGAIECKNQYGECTESISQDLKKIEGTRLLGAKGRIKKTLFENFLIKNYSIQFQLPVGFVVHLVERKAKFALENTQEGKIAVIDNDGTVLTLGDSTTLPKISIVHPLPEPGMAVGNQDFFALKIFGDIVSLYKVKEAHLTDQGLNIVLSDGTQVMFPLEGEKKVLVGSLNFIMNQLKSEESDSTIVTKDESTYIDLRFKNPVIKEIIL